MLGHRQDCKCRTIHDTTFSQIPFSGRPERSRIQSMYAAYGDETCNFKTMFAGVPHQKILSRLACEVLSLLDLSYISKWIFETVLM